MLIDEIRRRGARMCLGWAALLLAAIHASAQEFPTKPIKIISGVGVGGTFDIFLRALGEELTRRWGQAVIIEPRPGGNNIIAMRACIEAPPDGHTLCSLSGDNIVLPEFLVKTLDFDLRGGVRPIAHLFYNPQMLVVSATLGARTLDEVAAAGKKRPGTFAYTSPSLTSQLFMEWFDRKHRLDAVSVPFRGGSDALGNLLSGSIQFLFTGAANFAPFIADGKIHPLVVDSPLRLSQYPDVPTLREAGFGGPLVRNYLGLMAPAKTPDALARLINARVNEIMNDPTFRQRHLIDRGLEPANGTIEDFAAYIASDRVASKQAVTDANLAPQ